MFGIDRIVRISYTQKTVNKGVYFWSKSTTQQTLYDKNSELSILRSIIKKSSEIWI